MKEEAKGKGDVLRKLFFSCLYLSTFTFGGGYVIVTLMKKKFVDDYQWIDEKECWIWLQLPNLHQGRLQ